VKPQPSSGTMSPILQQSTSTASVTASWGADAPVSTTVAGDPVNVQWYQRHGFVVSSEEEAPDGGPEVFHGENVGWLTDSITPRVVFCGLAGRRRSCRTDGSVTGSTESAWSQSPGSTSGKTCGNPCQ
jgi:hypothetical protein